jgi:bifunctional UDP-N-acetylglucosamine pyrophosphorylase/glucosamine-1-phosphate N-acetyltransferase
MAASCARRTVRWPIVEQKDATDAQREITEINSGLYAFDAAVLRKALAEVGTDNVQGEKYLTDVLGIAGRQGLRVSAHLIQDLWQTEGVNDRVQLARLGAELNRRVVEGWMRAGVTVVDPATTWIDTDVRLGRDVTIHQQTQLHGVSVIGDDVVLGPDTTLTDVTIGDGATVIRTHGSLAIIGAGAMVGPFSYLRPGTELGVKGKIGTFVETKNAQIGAGSKVPHLTYVGDATIGEHSNIGASSVFVNYDGVNKMHTTIGSHCRTGSDNMFVAPVTVGDGAYTGAGTVVRQDVPPGALAINVSPQRNLHGWVQRKRAGTASAQAAAAASEDSPIVSEDSAIVPEGKPSA